MTSSINPNNIDATYPVAGQDNDSQGFRDNFTNTKNNFTFAQTEINDLQTNVMLKSALSGESLDNDGGGALMKDFEVRDFSETRIAKGALTGTVTFDYKSGGYQTVTTSGSVTLAFSDFPASGKLGRIVIEVTVSNITHTVTLPAAVSVNTATISGYDTNVITYPATGTYKYEFTTHDAGSAIAIIDNSTARTLTIADTITAGSTQTQGGATALTAGMNRVTISGTDGDGVKLPLASPGAEVVIINADATETIQVWPNTSDTIDGGSADAVDAVSLAAGNVRRYVAVDGTDWYTPDAATAATAVTVTSATQAAITTLANVVEVGALNAGSITSGFTSIDVGAGAITTTGTVSADVVSVTGYVLKSLTGTITAGSTQTMAGATALITDINIVTVVGTTGDGVALPAAQAGMEIFIANEDSAEALQVWPSDGASDNIDGGGVDAVDASSLAAGAVRRYVAIDGTNWVTA